MTKITSPHNEGLKEVRRLARRRERERSGRFVAEGEDLIAAAHAAGRAPLAGYRVSGSDVGGPAFADVEPDALAAVSTLGSGTRALAVYEQRWAPVAGPLCVYLHGVQDPGNVGAVLRSALAFGASCVALGPGCADPHGPKAVRASMGALFAVPLARAAGPEDLPGERIALAARAGQPLHGPAGGEVSLVVGGERNGLPEAVLAACDRAAHIPIASESLNAAMAATVALYEMTRGWRSRPQAGEPGPSPFPSRLGRS
jgi:TrmH family RNA methyltransferase